MSDGAARIYQQLEQHSAGSLPTGMDKITRRLLLSMFCWDLSRWINLQRLRLWKIPDKPRGVRLCAVSCQLWQPCCVRRGRRLYRQCRLLRAQWRPFLCMWLEYVQGGHQLWIMHRLSHKFWHQCTDRQDCGYILHVQRWLHRAA